VPTRRRPRAKSEFPLGVAGPLALRRGPRNASRGALHTSGAVAAVVASPSTHRSVSWSDCQSPSPLCVPVPAGASQGSRHVFPRAPPWASIEPCLGNAFAGARPRRDTMQQRVRRNSSDYSGRRITWAAVCPSRRMCAVLLLTLLGTVIPGLSVLLILASHPDIQCDINAEVRLQGPWPCRVAVAGGGAMHIDTTPSVSSGDRSGWDVSSWRSWQWKRLCESVRARMTPPAPPVST
jgi:hypothetical protein